MDRSLLFWVFLSLTIFFLGFSSSSSPSSPTLEDILLEYKNHTAISEFRLLNRKADINYCPDLNPNITINIDSNPQLSDEENVTVNIWGVSSPEAGDWVGMISPSHADISNCPWSFLENFGIGDLTWLPGLCHYPVKAQYASSDPDYLSCKKKQCHESVGGVCSVRTCGASLKFHVVNFRTDIRFVFFAKGFESPCVLRISDSVSFANPNMPLYGHISSVDSTATSMRVTWVSGDNRPQKVQYGDGKSATSQVTTFTQDDMCAAGQSWSPSPATDIGWHDPGFIHSAVMTGLQPSTKFFYKYGSDSAGWSDEITFKTPPAGGSDELSFIVFGDMGKAPRDASYEHFIQPGSISVIEAIADEASGGNVDSIFHIGDISYATGFMVEWDYFLSLIHPVASTISYMTAIGNHERDFFNSGSVYASPDSGGECGIPYETYFPMPTVEKDKPWYSIEQGSVHFTVISTEHDWSKNSEQYNWMKNDMAAVDRSKTPWLIFTGHRPMYSSKVALVGLNVDERFVEAVEPLLLENKVDLALFGHVHNYERTCAVYQSECKAMPKKDANGVDTFDNSNYAAPVHVIVGSGGFDLDDFPNVGKWSLVRKEEFGYATIHATKNDLIIKFINSHTKNVDDTFKITKGDPKWKHIGPKFESATLYIKNYKIRK